MDYFLQQLINGLALGAIYGLIAIGYTMVYGILGMINFAHGDIFMVGAFIAMIVFMTLMALPMALPIVVVLLLMLIMAMIFTSVWSWVVERVAYRPLRGSFRLAPLITAIGMSFVISNFVQVEQSPRNKPIPNLVTGHFTIPGTDVLVLYKQVIVVVVTATLLVIFSYIMNKTPLGRAQRAVEQDSKMAALLGVNVDRTISITFVIGAALAAIAGMLYLVNYGQVHFSDGFIPGIKAFTAAVLGGVGSLPGAVIGGLLIGLIEALWQTYFLPEYKDVAVFAVLAIVLIFMPSGLMGRPEVEKV
ncbi:branched-chain amino acid ABC transporter permease [Bartonella sp. DGB2]|uniref:branched-chain amino acid ABC transporter permease n=1 Tax=Bartonella sp. DGB2 TaxID=3388426 RepID=UPI0039902AD4